eukprot:GFKZ01011827.1.p1 GENE.GFKZ01011827.1~~GFKZ01011827.1.p1  ORF type:complete len:284 (-),score=26.87 GFKZ01011827.1:120-971(-)
MSSALSTIVFSLLVASSFASDAVELDTSNCAIKGAPGIYTYNPNTDEGPEDWGSIIPEFSTCGDGTKQSPVNFITDVSYGPLSMGPKPALRNANFTFASTTENWALSCEEEKACGYTDYNGTRYYHINTHFHSPSEHTLNGRQYPLESHFVHASEDGQLAVIATMYEYALESTYPGVIYAGGRRDFGVNKYFERIMDGVSAGKEEVEVLTKMVVKPSKGYCTLTGSLTTPPCTEGVTWIMSMNVETVSKRQVHGYQTSAGATFDGNNRPTQPLNGREITCYVK